MRFWVAQEAALKLLSCAYHWIAFDIVKTKNEMRVIGSRTDLGDLTFLSPCMPGSYPTLFREREGRAKINIAANSVMKRFCSNLIPLICSVWSLDIEKRGRPSTVIRALGYLIWKIEKIDALKASPKLREGIKPNHGVRSKSDVQIRGNPYFQITKDRIQ